MKIVRQLPALIGISALAATSRTILTEDRRSFAGWARGVVLAVFVGYVTQQALHDTTFGTGTQGAIVAFAGFVDDDILLFIIALARQFRDNPGAVMDWILRRKGGDQ